MMIGICVAVLSLMVSTAGDQRPEDAPVLPARQQQLADARPYTHCHNLPRRTYCHSSQKLPKNWPPNTSAPEPASDGNEAAAPLPKAVAPATGEERK